MQVALLTALGKIELIDVPMPEPNQGEVRVKIAAVGVCASDVHYYQEGKIGANRLQFPASQGHEPSGIIDKVGEGCSLKVGTRVMIEPAYPCGKCEYCLSGRYNICPHVEFLGSPPCDGVFKEFAIIKESCCIPLPDNVSLVEAALLEPVGVGLHAVKLAKLEVGESVVVFGAGAIGLSCALAANLSGAGKVLIIDPVNERLDFAKKFCSVEVFNSKNASVLAWIKEHTAGKMPDVVFEAAGTQEAITNSCLSTRIGGRVVLVGIPSEEEVKIPIHESRRKELAMFNVRRANYEAKVALALLANKKIAVKSLATHFFPLTKIKQALQMAVDKKDGLIRAIIQPHIDLVDK